MSEVIKVFTPVKRVPTMIGKAPNGRKLPFGPYTLPQVGAGTVVLLITAVMAMTLPVNPAVPFITGVVIAILAVFALGLVPYTGIRLSSRVLWVGRLLLARKPVPASGMPISADTPQKSVLVDESVVVLLPQDFVPVLASGDH